MCHFGVIYVSFVSFRCHLGVIYVSFWCHFCVIKKIIQCKFFFKILVSFMCHFGVILVTFEKEFLTFDQECGTSSWKSRRSWSSRYHCRENRSCRTCAGTAAPANGSDAGRFAGCCRCAYTTATSDAILPARTHRLSQPKIKENRYIKFQVIFVSFW